MRNISAISAWKYFYVCEDLVEKFRFLLCFEEIVYSLGNNSQAHQSQGPRTNWFVNHYDTTSSSGIFNIKYHKSFKSISNESTSPHLFFWMLTLVLRFSQIFRQVLNFFLQKVNSSISSEEMVSRVERFSCKILSRKTKLLSNFGKVEIIFSKVVIFWSEC